MFNKKGIILILLTIFCIGLTVSSVSAMDNSADNLTIDETESVLKLSPNEFNDREAKEWTGPVELEEMDIHADKKLPASDIQELRAAKNSNIELVKKYSYKTSDGYKLVKAKSNTYKNIYVDVYGLKDLKKYKCTDTVYKKIPKSIHNIAYNSKLGKYIYNNEWEIKKIKKIKKTYKWKSTKWMEKKVGTKKVWVTKKIKTYESWVDSDGNLYKSKYWSPYKKYGYNIKYVKSVWRYYSDGDICYDYYKVKVNKPIYKSYYKIVTHKQKLTFYKVKLKKIIYKKVSVPHKLIVFTRANKQPGFIHDYYYEGDHMIDQMYWK